jgi:hypothetical protein
VIPADADLEGPEKFFRKDASDVMGLPKGARLVSLAAFNLGVEAGQLAVVLAVMPLAYLLRSTPFYRRGVMPWGSSAIACLALVWFVQRAML